MRHIDDVSGWIEENPTRRGVFVLNQLQAQDFSSLVDRVEGLVRTYDKGVWKENATAWGISPDVLSILDEAQPPAHYPYYFCNPQILKADPMLVTYYRNVAMVSQEVMSDLGLHSMPYEAGLPLASAMSEELTRHFNQIVSALLAQTTVTLCDHLEMAYSNLGDSLGGAWRKEMARRRIKPFQT